MRVIRIIKIAMGLKPIAMKIDFTSRCLCPHRQQYEILTFIYLQLIRVRFIIGFQFGQFFFTVSKFGYGVK